MAMEIWVVKIIGANFRENNPYFSLPRDIKVFSVIFLFIN